jgi:hypothetical protein
MEDLNITLEPNRLYRRKHAAKILDCSINHIDKLSRQGKLCKIKITRKHSGITGRSLIALIDG